MIRDIAGRQNQTVRLARKLLKKKHRRERGLLVCEGLDLLRAAVEARATVREVLVRRDLVEELPPRLLQEAETAAASGSAVAGVNVGVCDAETLEYAASLGGGVDVIFICEEPVWHLADVPVAEGVTFFLDRVADPGNVGTVIRSALAFGLAGVVCSPGTADAYSPKAMRAGMGAQFGLPVVVDVSPEQLKGHLEALRVKGETGLQIWVADPHSGDDVRAVQPRAGTIIVLGRERTGAGGEWSGARRVTIPQVRFESINVAMAGTIFAYECSRYLRAPSTGIGPPGPLVSTSQGVGKEEPS